MWTLECWFGAGFLSAFIADFFNDEIRWKLRSTLFFLLTIAGFFSIFFTIAAFREGYLGPKERRKRIEKLEYAKREREEEEERRLEREYREVLKLIEYHEVEPEFIELENRHVLKPEVRSIGDDVALLKRRCLPDYWLRNHASRATVSDRENTILPY